ncbi:MAG: citrate synthase, partial [Acidobacteria bacterium]|nr:citrate synthase [Acidobacteriota bacterium]
MENAKEAAAAPATDKPKEASAPAAAAGGAGLRGVVAASSSIGDVNGEQGILIYQGYDIHDLAEHSTFEETVYLLWHGRLPNGAEFESFKRDIGEHYELPPQVVELIRQFPREAEPMDMLRTAVSALDFYDKECCDITREGALRTATRLTAQFPVLVAAIERIRNGQDPIPAKPELNIATNFLYMLKGEMPSERAARIFDICLILHADHELNASTFTARVVAGTLADVYGAVTAAIAALSGPLHGGANTNVMKMLLEIGELEKAEDFVKNALAQKKKIMGIGHAVYKTEDPRATHLRKFSKEVGESHGETKWYEISRKIEEYIHQ